MSAKFDSTSPKDAQLLVKAWADTLNQARKTLAATPAGSNSGLRVTINILDRLILMFKAARKASPTSAEVASACDSLTAAGGTGNAAHATVVVTKKMETLLANRGLQEAASLLLMSEGGPTTHGLSIISESSARSDVAMDLLAKLVSKVFPSK